MLFFRQILFLADSPSVELNDLLFTVNSYFAINTGSAKREVYTIVQSISCYFFRDSKLTGVTFFDASGTSIKILNPVYRPVDLTYFTFFLSALFKHLYYRAPTKLLTL